MANEVTNQLPIRWQITGLVVSILICFIAAGLGSMATTTQIPGWYAELTKPSWTPPSWLFGPVWTILYLAMAVAAWLVWRQTGLVAVRWPLTWFGVQLVLNTLWSVIFFGLHQPGWAAFEIGWLWAAILITLLSFWSRSKIAGLLLVPYLLWVSFAAVLNVSIWRLNA